jgi:hypothetical protein
MAITAVPPATGNELCGFKQIKTRRIDAARNCSARTSAQPENRDVAGLRNHSPDAAQSLQKADLGDGYETLS